MGKMRQIGLIGFLAAASLWAQEMESFTLTPEERKEYERIMEIKRDFLKKFPGWFESAEEVPIENLKLERRVGERKEDYQKRIERVKAYIKQQEEEAKRKREEAKRQEDAKQAETERLKKEKEAEAAKAKAEAEAEAFRKSPMGQALELLHAKRYHEAYEAFFVLFMENPESERINFYLGLSAIGDKEYESAVAAFERVLIKQPDHMRARLELARSLFYMKSYEEAEKHFIAMLESGKLPPAVEVNVRRFLAVIDDAKIRNHFHSVVMVGLQYDSNINNDIGTSSYVISPDLLPGGIPGNDPVSDVNHQEMVGLNHIYDFGKIGNYFMKNSAVLLKQNYLENTGNNVLFASLASGIGVKKEAYSYLIQLHYDQIDIGGEALMNIMGLNVQSQYPLDQHTGLSANLKLDTKNYKDNDGYDADFKELNLGYNKKIPDSKERWGVGLLISQERTDTDTVLYIDRDIVGLNGSYEMDLSDKLTIKTLLDYKMFTYTNEQWDENLDLKKRDDSQYRILAGGSYRYTKAVQFNGSLSYLNNTSSHVAYDYDKTMATLNCMWAF